jgi:hypothetical protein
MLERSVLGGLDPRVRLGAVLVFIFVLLSIQNLSHLFVVVLVSRTAHLRNRTAFAAR